MIIRRFGAMLEEFEVNDAIDFTVATRYGPEAVEALRQQKGLQSRYTGQVQHHYSNGNTSVASLQNGTQQQQQYTNSQMYNPGFN